MTKRVLIVGASIAGPALAHWLHRYGFSVTVVERAPQLRPGGQAVDVRGVGKEVVRRMGLDERIRAACTETNGVSYVDERNRERARMRSDAFGGDGMVAEIEILRGDLADVLHEATRHDVEYRFGRTITGIEQTRDGMTASFTSGPPESFDVVVGADGLHSGVRSLVFGPESRYLRDLGFLMAFFTVPNRLGLDHWMLSYAEPKRGAMIRSIRDNREAMALLCVPGSSADHDHRDPAGQKALLREGMRHAKWEVPWLLEQMDGAPDFHCDSCSQVCMPSWSAGRVVLLGDAAYCSSPLSGQGTTLALVGAYVLAGELAAADDHATAFAAYEAKMRDFVAMNQQLGADNAKHAAASSRFGIWVQHQMIRLLPHLPGQALMQRKMLRAFNGIELPDYDLLPAARG
ncbi:2-polyprenyl-6-methoxyphenol hydroxylase [Saccharopolyspora kobensis]|uniref:2-polyprenyl-6-methoxyphenol hydroxylase n=1 Tax=Saccharopolyspora kobensis TaxID=146035 RepID=A0A1H6DR32_9PSEU|nr:FAD-dependent monooxygenase [Saccharopolyspora kobensis]SEG87708.1 2-polyprenyl-6-methoxyphenol hydroxylase [Saccharopolyspora kobensis]SFE05463.1 2-polyprenyl-6-methoxyphenol hydroxylase [Saccharopolyspora kobensis]